MIQTWYKGMRERDKVEFEKHFNQSHFVRERLKLIIEEKVESRLKVSSRDYDCPSWAHKQAHDNGYHEAMREILNLIRDSNPNDR